MENDRTSVDGELSDSHGSTGTLSSDFHIIQTTLGLLFCGCQGQPLMINDRTSVPGELSDSRRSTGTLSSDLI